MAMVISVVDLGIVMFRLVFTEDFYPFGYVDESFMYCGEVLEAKQAV